MKWFLFFLTLSYLHAVDVWRGEVEGGFTATIQSSAHEIPFLEPLKIELVLTYPEGYVFNPSLLRSHLLKNATPDPSPFVLTKETSLIQENKATLQYTLEAQIPGKFTLSFYDIAFFPKDSPEGKNAVIFAPLQPITVVASPLSISPTESPAPFLTFSRQLPVDLNQENRNLLQELAAKEYERNAVIQQERSIPWGMLGTVALAALLYAWYRFLHAPVAHEKWLLRDARDEVLRDLEELQKEPSDELFEELSNDVRVYVENRYGIDATRKTTQEFLESLPTQFSPKDQLQVMLRLSDQIKFAKGTLPKENLTKVWQAVETILKE